MSVKDLKDFIKKRKEFEIGEFVFQEPTIKEMIELQDFFTKALKENMLEFDFYLGFLSRLLKDKKKENKLKEEMLAMPINQVSEFFFYVLDQLGINFTKGTVSPQE